jgi:hypothetical protein
LAPAAAAPHRRRRWWLWLLLLPPVLLLLAGGGLIWRASSGPISLPAALQDRIGVRLDTAMAANRISVSDIAVMLRPGLVPAVMLDGVELRDAGGGLRAVFPQVAVTLDHSALLARAFRPQYVEVAGAGLRLRRDAAGGVDLELAIGGRADAVSLQDTLARMDAMFAAPVFDRLEEVRGTALTLDLEDAITGQTLRARDAVMRLERKGGVLTLNIAGQLQGTRNSDIMIAATRDATAGETTMRLDFNDLAARDVATVTPALAWLDLMRAPISGAITARLTDDGNLGDLWVGLEIGAGQITLGDGVRAMPFRSMGVDLTFDATAQRIQVDRLSMDAAELSLEATGHADLSDDGQALVAQLQLSNITADPAGVFDAPLAIEGGAVDLRLTLAPQVQVEIGQAVLFDGPLRLRATGRAVVEDGGLRLSIDAQVPDVAARDVLSYWPTAAVPNTRAWLETNIIAGQLAGVDLALRAVPGEPLRSVLQMDFRDTTLQALPDLPPITAARGYLSLEGPRLVLAMEDGAITVPDGGGVVSLAGSTMVIADVTPRGPMADFALQVSGDLPDVLRLLDGPPVNIFATGNLTPQIIGTGRAALEARVSTRLLRGQRLPDMAIAVSGSVTDFRSDRLVPGRVLAADTLAVDVSNTAVLISGRATLDDVPVTGTWQRAIGPGAAPGSVVDARAPLDRAVLQTFGVDLPADMISGAGTADLRLRLNANGPARLSVSSDLAGVALSLPALAWRMGPDQTGRLAAEIILGPAPAIPEISLTGAGLDMTGVISLREGGGLDRLNATRFRIGNWLDVTGAVVGRGVGVAPAVEVTGGTFDLRNAPAMNRSDGGTASGPLTLSLDRMQITQGIALTGIRADLTTTGGLSGQFRAAVNGAAPVTGTIVITDDGPAVRLQSNDGGAVLRAAGLFQGGYGGAMTLTLVPTGEAGTYDGQLNIDGPRLRNAPAMAELLNLISVVGLLEQLGGEGINLGDVEGRFRLTPRAIFLTQGAAVGPSMGISLDGVYDITNDQMEMQGVISPLYIVNGLIGALFAPRREGLFGFSYRLTGPGDGLQVTVNPLSILTPGVFRDIFRRPPPELQELSQ